MVQEIHQVTYCIGSILEFGEEETSTNQNNMTATIAILVIDAYKVRYISDDDDGWFVDFDVQSIRLHSFPSQQSSRPHIQTILAESDNVWFATSLNWGNASFWVYLTIR